MKKILFSIFSAFMVSTMASAQYLNVKMDDGTYASYKTSSKTEVDFGKKKGAELTPAGYYTKNEVDAIIQKLEDRLEKAENEIAMLRTNHEYVELAGYKWATENVGAVPGLTAYSEDPKYGYLYNQDDALKAARSWGGTWALPTNEQWEALLGNCYWVWVSDYNGLAGFIAYEAQTEDDKGKCICPPWNEQSEAYSPATIPHIFLPAAGEYVSYNSQIDAQGSSCLYYSANSGADLGYLVALSCTESMAAGGAGGGMSIINKLNGLAVRPVSE